jgi:hypothetical protein
VLLLFFGWETGSDNYFITYLVGGDVNIVIFLKQQKIVLISACLLILFALGYLALGHL